MENGVLCICDTLNSPLQKEALMERIIINVPCNRMNSGIPMHVYIIFAHPARMSFSREVLQAFTAGLHEARHTYEVGDLYRMKFSSELSSAEYHREIHQDARIPVPPDVMAEHEKIGRADALAFIYPLWWSDCPAKLKGWFDRVWTYGYAYFYEDGERKTVIDIEKAVVLCSAGHTREHLEITGIAEGMRSVMLGDRLLGVGVKSATMEILGGMIPENDSCREINLLRAYRAGRDI